MQLKKFGKFHFNYVPNIPIPEDAYQFVRALDELIEEFSKKNFEQKLEIQGLRKNSHTYLLKKITLHKIGIKKFHLDLYQPRI